jgi:Leucine-rich repeat (LRR) protein
LRSFSQLKILDLSEGKFQNLPEELGDLQNLVWLDLSNCFNLEILPNAVGQLHALKYLNLNFCENLANLPSGVVGLTSLQQLGANCDKLIWADDIPSHTASLEDICRLGLLTDLRIFGVSGLELTHNISALKKLKILYLGLTNLTFLPDEMGYWYVQLQELHLWCLYDLVYLPDNFTREGAFPALIQLELFQCSKFVCFPEVKIGALPKLQRLEFNGCDSLKILPLSLDVLTSLTKLSLFECNDSLRDSCTENCDESEQWRKFNIRYEM